MAVASLGVANTIVAALRTRQWTLGVLRAIGLTRGELLRLVLVEAVLLAIVGAILGVASGLVMSLNANRLYQILIGFAPPMAVPWGVVLLGSAAVVVLSLLASAWPARSIARREPLELLQAGRSFA
jgi:putative ABC transport system permease protein